MGLGITATELPRQGLWRKDLQLPMGHLGICFMAENPWRLLPGFVVEFTW